MERKFYLFTSTLSINLANILVIQKILKYVYRIAIYKDDIMSDEVFIKVVNDVVPLATRSKFNDIQYITHNKTKYFEKLRFDNVLLYFL